MLFAEFDIVKIVVVTIIKLSYTLWGFEFGFEGMKPKVLTIHNWVKLNAFFYKTWISHIIF
jgi:hypothetical protein